MWKKIKISLSGLFYAFNEKSFVYELILGLFIAGGFFLNILNKNILIIFSLYVTVLSIEIINTAIEKLCNKITTSDDEQIREIKDLGSAAVFILLLALFLLIADSIAA